MKHWKLAFLASLALLFVSCGSKLDGKYSNKELGGGYIFEGSKVTIYYTEDGTTVEETGTFTFDDKTNEISITWSDSSSEKFKYDPTKKSISNDDFANSFTKE